MNPDQKAIDHRIECTMKVNKVKKLADGPDFPVVSEFSRTTEISSMVFETSKKQADYTASIIILMARMELAC